MANSLTHSLTQNKLAEFLLEAKIICFPARWTQSRQLRHIMICLSNITPFLRVYRRDKPTQDVGRAREKLVNHEPRASDLQVFRVFSQHPKWVYHAGKLIEKVFYCFYEITMTSVCQERTLL